jgi:hypothetical protein
MTLEPAPQGVSSYGGFVYWVDYSSDRILRVASTGGDTATIASGMSEHFPREVVADCHGVYWSIGNYGDETRVLRSGAASPETFAQSGGPMALDATHLYVAGRATTIRVPLGGGSPETVGAANPSDIYRAVSVDATDVYWVGADGIYRARK